MRPLPPVAPRLHGRSPSPVEHAVMDTGRAFGTAILIALASCMLLIVLLMIARFASITIARANEWGLDQPSF